jgi:prophage regulatory protein
MTTKSIRINRKSEVLNRISFGKSTLHNKINAGIFPPSISLGARAVGFIEHEVDSVLNAMAAGKNESELKDLVADLVNQRKLAA